MDDFAKIVKGIPKDISVLKNVYLSGRQYPFLLAHQEFGILVVVPLQYQQWKTPANYTSKIVFHENQLNYQMTSPASILQELCCYLSYWLQCTESRWFKKDIQFGALPTIRGLFFVKNIPGDKGLSAELTKIFSQDCSLSEKKEWHKLLGQEISSLVTFIAGLPPVVSGAHEIYQQDLDRWVRRLAEKIIDADDQDRRFDFKKEEDKDFHFDELSLSGFKAYGTETAVSFKPITILLGKNNSGKSTIIQVLLLLKQSLENLRKGVPLRFHGPYWDLGNHENCCYDKKTEVPIYFKLTFKNQLGQKRAFGFEFSTDQNKQSVLKKLEYYESPGTTETERTEFPLYTFVRDDQSNRLVLTDDIDSEHPAWAKKVSELHRQIESGKINESIPTESSSLIKMLTAEATQAVIEPTAFLPNRPKASDPVYSDNPTYSDVYSIFFKELIELTQTMRGFLYSIVYVGPNRPYIKRFYPANDMRSMDDEHTWDMLEDNLSQKDVNQRVNQWLEKFEIGYEINISETSLSGTDILSPELIPTNSHKGVSLAFSDAGQGITHLLPIIVTLVAKRDSFIIIEDPEVHIHPRLQASLGDLFIESVKENRNFILIESHSEYILDRLQLGIAKENIVNTKIAIYYLKIGKKPNVPDIEELQLNKYGMFKDEIPAEFFDAGIDDSEQQIEKVLERKQKEMNGSS